MEQETTAIGIYESLMMMEMGRKRRSARNDARQRISVSMVDWSINRRDVANGMMVNPIYVSVIRAVFALVVLYNRSYDYKYQCRIRHIT